MERENLAGVVCECLNLPCPRPDLKDWAEMVDYLRNPNTEVTIALVGKYIQLHDAYVSVVEALKHGGIFSRATVNIKWVDSETINAENVYEILKDVHGILVPGGFGHRGINGKLEAIKFARTQGIPFGAYPCILLSGLSPDGHIVEIIELTGHPWFIATQAHPELKSRPNRPHPLFRGFIDAALVHKG